MANIVRAASVAAALALGPVAASATTIVNNGGTYDLLADSYFFNGDFEIGDKAGSYTFDFINTASTTASVVFGATVLQVSAAFKPGVAFLIDGQPSVSVVAGETTGFVDSFFVDAGETVSILVAFGRVVDTGLFAGGMADIDFALEASVAAVPVPASALLLASAVGGLAFARRRKARAA